MTTALMTLGGKMATRFGMDSNADVVPVLKATAFKGQATDAQLIALLIVADQYGLNPFTKEIYAFPDKNNGIVPVVGVDGWARIINSHPQFDGMDFNDDGESVECVIYRKDRSHPIKAREYMAECKRDTQPWRSHPRRMLRHKAMIQCARLAFGYVGIYEQDEAERIIEKDVNARPTRQSGADVASRAAETVEFMDAETRAQLLADLGAVAETGTEALERAWMGLTKEYRKALASDLDGLKARAAKADDATVEDGYVPQ